MPRFAANLTFLFTEIPFMERFAAARRAGLDAVEFMFPYDYKLEDIKARLSETGLQLVLCNLPAGNWAGGDRGTAGNPERKEEFREGVVKGIDAARTLGVGRLNCLVGQKNEAFSDGEISETLMENIRYAAKSLQKENIRLMVEPVNPRCAWFALNTWGRFSDCSKRSAIPTPISRSTSPRPARERGRQRLRSPRPDGHIRSPLPDATSRAPETASNFADGLDRGRRVRLMEYIPEPDTLSSWLPSHGYHQ